MPAQASINASSSIYKINASSSIINASSTHAAQAMPTPGTSLVNQKNKKTGVMNLVPIEKPVLQPISHIMYMHSNVSSDYIHSFIAVSGLLPTILLCMIIRLLGQVVIMERTGCE